MQKRRKLTEIKLQEKLKLRNKTTKKKGHADYNIKSYELNLTN